jgi:hypothetical protein
MHDTEFGYFLFGNPRHIKVNTILNISNLFGLLAGESKKEMLKDPSPHLFSFLL